MSEIDSEIKYTAVTYLVGNLIVVACGSALAAISIRYAWITKDKSSLRNLIWTGGVLLVIHTVLAFADTVRTFGDGFGNVERVTALSPIFVTNMVIGAVLAALVQSFYGWRAYILLERSLWLLALLILLIIFAFVSTVTAHLMALTSDDPALFQTNGGSLQAFVLLRLPYIAAIAIDAVLCALTLLALYRANLFGSPQGVGMVIKRLVILTITSNGLTTIFFIVLLISSFQAPGVFWSLTLASGDAYMFTMLCWLYARRSNGQGTSQQALSTSHARSKGTRRPEEANKTFTENIVVHQQTALFAARKEEDDLNYELEEYKNEAPFRA